MPVIDITTKAELDAQLKQAAGKVLVVDFYADWCGPCKAIAPTYHQLSDKHQGKAIFLRVNSDNAKPLAGEFGIRALPTFVFFAKGSKVETLQGADAAGLTRIIDDLVAKHSAFAGGGSGFRLGSSGSAPSAAAPAAAAGAKPAAAVPSAGTAAGAGAARRNPWADPNWVPPGMKKDGDAAKPMAGGGAAMPAKPVPQKPSAQPPAAATAPAVAATKPTAPAAAVAPASAAPSTAPPANKNPFLNADPHFQPPAPASATPKQAASAVDPVLLNSLIDMGFPDARAQRALQATGNKNLEDALNWLVSHEEDEVMHPVSSSQGSGHSGNAAASRLLQTQQPASSASEDVDMAPVPRDAPTLADDLEEMDEGLRAIVQAARNKPAAPAAEADEPQPKKPMSEMTLEEKQAWLEERKRLGKIKREQRALEAAKESERSRREISKASMEIQRKREEDMMKAAYDKKKKEEREQAEHRKRIQEKIREDKERRKREADAEKARLAALKANNGQK